MFIVILLCSFFTQINASDEMVVSVEEFLSHVDRVFKGQRYKLTPLHPRPREDLVTIHLPKLHQSTIELLALDDFELMCAQLTTGEGEGLVRVLQVYDPHHILMHHDKFSPILSESEDEGMAFCNDIAVCIPPGGTRQVRIYSHKDGKVCFKRKPEAPGIEKITYNVFRMLFPLVPPEEAPLPKTITILMNKQPFLVSQFMEGESFAKILRYLELNPDHVSKRVFNLDKFQRLTVFCAVTAPEDFRTQNCLLRTIADSDECEFALFDTERSCGQERTEDYRHPVRGKIHTRCHCVLLNFHEMLAYPLTERVIAELASAKQAILEYLKEFEKNFAAASQKSLILKTLVVEGIYHGELTRIMQGARETKVILGMPLSIVSLCGMTSRLSPLLSLTEPVYRSKSLASLISQVSPELSAIYGLNQPILAPATPVVDLRDILKRTQETDGGRCADTTPPSADVPLELYFGPLNMSVKMQLLMNLSSIIQGRFNDDSIDVTEKMKMLMGMLFGISVLDRINRNPIPFYEHVYEHMEKSIVLYGIHLFQWMTRVKL